MPLVPHKKPQYSVGTKDASPSRWIASRHRILASAAGVLSASLCLSVASTEASGQAGATPQADRLSVAIEALERAGGSGMQLRRSAHAGTATFLRMDRGAGIASGELATAPAEHRARAFLRRHGDALGVPDPARLVAERSVRFDALGMEHVRLQQRYGGLRVRAAELSVHLDGADVVAANGRVVADPIGLDLVPALDAARASAIALQLMNDEYAVADPDIATLVLELFNAGLFDGRPAATRLAWHLEASSESLRVAIWIDAHDGEVLLHFNSLPDALNRQIHDAMDTPNVPGVLARSEGQAPTGVLDVDDIYEYAGDTYDYFLAEHGRDSYDGAGAPMRASVHFCSDSPDCAVVCPCSNAFWYGTFAVFGLLKSDDIVGHEFTHGVVDHSAGLIYLNQSGALNESYADLFGESIDLTNGAGLDTPEVRWLIDEDLIPASGIRNMADPTLGFLTPDPGKLTDPELACTPDDSGGVHTNSGIGNHAYALMVDGGTYNGQTISGIGLSKAAEIEYRALTAYLLSGSTYQDHYDALQQSCGDLVGTSGISASDCLQVKKAADAVEMNLPWPCNCGNGSPDLGEECDDGNTVSGDGCSRTCLIEAPQVPSTSIPAWLLLAGLVAVIGALAIVRQPLPRYR